MSIFHKYKQLVSVFLAVIILSGLYTPLLHKEATPRAEALLAGLGNFSTEGTQLLQLIEDGVSSVQNTITAGASSIIAGNSVSIFGKEFVLDGILYAIGRTILKSMVASIVQWINSGFEGSPAFVTDLKGFLLQVADEAAGEFIYGTDLDILCSPFQLDIRIALALQYETTKDFGKARCTLSGVIDNVDNFLNGDFGDGGWQGWFELTANPQNTPAGAYLAAEAELGARIVNAEGRELKLLDFGDGFFSTTICEAVHGEDTSQENCFISTPGKVIEEALTFNLSIGQRSLINADEINEIISALFAQLAQKAITGAKGLLGLSQGGFNSSGESYLNAMTAEAEIIREGRRLFLQPLSDQREFITFNHEIIELVNDAEIYNQRARNQFIDPVTGQVICYQLQLPRQLERARETATTSIVLAEIAITALENLRTRFEVATSSDEHLEIVDELERLRAENYIVDQIDVRLLDTEIISDVEPAIESFEAAVRDEISRCRRQQDGDGGR